MNNEEKKNFIQSIFQNIILMMDMSIKISNIEELKTESIELLKIATKINEYLLKINEDGKLDNLSIKDDYSQISPLLHEEELEIVNKYKNIIYKKLNDGELENV